MSVIQIEMQISTEQLFKAVERMPQNELEKFVTRLLALRAQPEVPRLSEVESELMLNINRGVPLELQHRYDELIDKRREETLNEDEYSELLRLTDEVEKLDVERMECLMELARLRKKPLKTLMQELGIKPPAYA